MSVKGLLRPEITILGELSPMISLKGRMNPPPISGAFDKLIATGYIAFLDIVVTFGTLKETIDFPTQVEIHTSRGNIIVDVDDWVEASYDGELPKEYDFVATYQLPSVFKSQPIVIQRVIFDKYWLLKDGVWNNAGIWVNKDVWNI